MKVYKIYQTSYRYGDENGVTENVFSTPEIRDDYYNLLYKMMQENTAQHEDVDEHTDEKFEYNDGGKWSYVTQKEDDDSYIIESFEVNKKGLIKFKYKE